MTQPAKETKAPHPSPSDNVEAPACPTISKKQDNPVSTSASLDVQATDMTALVQDMKSPSMNKTREYPDSWIYDEKNPEAYLESFFANQREIGKKWKELGMPAPSEVIEDAEGNLKLQHHQLPPPASQKPHKGDDPNATYSCMTRIRPEPMPKEIASNKAKSATPEREFIVVDTQKAHELQEQGWTLWDAPAPALNIKAGYKDVRECSRWFDVNTTDNPVADTAFFLGQANEFAETTMTDGKWRPGQLLGPDNSDPEVQAKSLSFAPFTPVKDMTEKRSATSTGHIHQWRRPIGIGPGWGSYDDFTTFQSYGRRIPKELVEERTWSTNAAAPFELKSTSGQTMRCDVQLVEDGIPVKQKPPVSLRVAQGTVVRTDG
ncbi:hypothetical protein UCRPA7_7798 [Phaeoacremonium minimum UCRPA7]|uniref:Uncharacterized protein n=1 Tax=Phaeoacremonium minimum (strain UCR-PA7) TaxID=1286976 RepID=R8BBQ2_PHAM7|nr:hypothetical protein UCRPA7_7798 [Phaeoacremonium minimum UCRPA7]EON96699.1 hypothetical protein UCRPA7_7798 [Phaeoacremonium minimum UCRPA7]